MNKTCKQCGGEFEITYEDLGFLEKVSPVIDGEKFNIPAPTLCPDCRNQRRMAFRNERFLYKRHCSLCKKPIIGAFDKNVPFPVYCVDCWWSDRWDPLDYGMDFDFSRGFFEQFNELLQTVPKVNFLQLQNENSPYNNLLAYSKNTYMSPGSYFMEDCFFCRKCSYSKDCYDCHFVNHCELLAFSVNCENCYSCRNLINCENCRDCVCMKDSVGCSNCFMCAGVHRKQFYYKNKQYSEAEYFEIVNKKLEESSEGLLDEFLEFAKTVIKKNLNLINCENCTGDYLQNSKNSFECYDCFDLEDCKYMFDCVGVKDSMDLSMHDKDIELCYEVCAGGDSNKWLRFSYCSTATFDSDYLHSCFYLKESFGCNGFHSKNKHCVLNKKYSEEDYKNLRKKIIKHMIERGEYGEYFPIELSLFSYNETSANYYYPLSKDDVLERGWRWKDEDPKQYLKSNFQVPEKIEQVEDSIVDEILACDQCGKNFKIQSSELKLCRKLKHPLSNKCFECRYQDLLSLKNPRKLWDRKCAKCGVDMKTTYSPDRPEMVYCEGCYLNEVY